MNSYAQDLYDTIYKNDSIKCTLRRRFIGILLVCIALIIYINMNTLQKQFNTCKPSLLNYSTVSHLRESRGPPYLAFIISATTRRFNATFVNLNTALPGHFILKRKEIVSHNDSRIFRTGDRQVSSLLLTYVDLWHDFGARPEAEFTDNDWIFLFEDDVNIVPNHIISSFHPKLYAKWNYTNPNSSLAGSKRLLRIKQSSFKNLVCRL
jgi:hypothetical protein